MSNSIPATQITNSEVPFMDVCLTSKDVQYNKTPVGETHTYYTFKADPIEGLNTFKECQKAIKDKWK
jgi:hypothetical protein